MISRLTPAAGLQQGHRLTASSLDGGCEIAIVVGLAAAVQVTVVGRVSREVHPLVVSLGLQISGATIGAVWILHRQAFPELGKIALAWWRLPLGALSWGIVAALGFSAARLGTTPTLVLVVASQLVAAWESTSLPGTWSSTFGNLQDLFP
jgi:hypothetical protein